MHGGFDANKTEKLDKGELLKLVALALGVVKQQLKTGFH